MEAEVEGDRKVLGVIGSTNDQLDSETSYKVFDHIIRENGNADSDEESTKENAKEKISMSAESKIGQRLPPLKHPVSKLKPPKHSSTRKVAPSLEKKFIPVKSSGYGKTTRSSSVPRNSSSGATSKADGGVRGTSRLLNSTSSSKLRARSVSVPRRINSAPASPAKSRDSSSSRSGSRIRSNAGTRFKNNEKSLSGSTWKQEQLEIKRRRQQNRIPKHRSHKRVSSDSGIAYEHALESPNKALKKTQISTPLSTKEDESLQSRTLNNDPNSSSHKSVSSTPIAKIKKVFRSISPKSNRNKAPKTPLQSPGTSWSKSVEISAIASDYFDRRKLALTADIASIESPSATKLDIKNLVEEIFAPGTGLTDEELRRVLNLKIKPTKQWDYKKKIESQTALIKKLRDSLNSLLQAKNRLVSASAEKEFSAKSTRNRVIRKAQLYEEENSVFKSKLKNLETKYLDMDEKYKEKEREFSRIQEKLTCMNSEYEALKEKFEESERSRTQVEINLAVQEGRCKEASKQADSWRAEIATIEASKSEAMKKAESNMEREVIQLREECASLRTKIESREEELGRLVDIDSGINSPGVSQVGEVKKEMDRLRDRENELENTLLLKDSEIERIIAEKEAAISRSNLKDSDLSELMKGLGDIQKSGQEREEKANLLRIAAEDKAGEIEVLLTEAKGENSILIHEKKTMQENLNKFHVDIESLEETIYALKEEIQNQKEERNSKETNLQIEKELRNRAESKEKEERNERIALSAQMVAMTKEHAQIEAQLKEVNDSQERHWEEKLAEEKEKIREKENESSQMKETITCLEGERSSLMESLSAKKNMADAKNVEEIGRLNGELSVLNTRLKESEKRATSSGLLSAEQIKSLHDELREGQAERRKMHNTIQELRGNVRVFARVRPFLPGDGENEEPCVVPKNENALQIALNSDIPQEHNFSFDRVFPPSVGQESIFQEVSELIQSALDGYNVCLFSYGQTGSGKTHTMQGSGVGQMRGIIPRAIEQVGKYKKCLEKDGWKYEMKVSFLEIYNETIRDLLREEKARELKHEIKVKSNGQRYVSDLTMRELEPTDFDGVNEVMRVAAKHRSIASTDMNSTSSRSHSVFTLHLTAVHAKQKQTLRGTLNLVDLAGSERLNRSGATGDRAKEAMSINKSLSSLTDVFTSIGKKASHIPFRNSKLTYLLQPSLSGDGKTLMMVNLSPTFQSYQESLCSLRFASQVNKCELGKARRTIEDVKNEDDKKRTKNYMAPSPQRYIKRKKAH